MFDSRHIEIRSKSGQKETIQLGDPAQGSVELAEEDVLQSSMISNILNITQSTQQLSRRPAPQRGLNF